MGMSKTWCPDCKREVLNVVGFIADGWEFTCGKCNQRFVVRFERVLTQRPPDATPQEPPRGMVWKNDEGLPTGV